MCLTETDMIDDAIYTLLADIKEAVNRLEDAVKEGAPAKDLVTIEADIHSQLIRLRQWIMSREPRRGS